MLDQNWRQTFVWRDSRNPCLLSNHLGHDAKAVLPLRSLRAHPDRPEPDPRHLVKHHPLRHGSASHPLSKARHPGPVSCLLSPSLLRFARDTKLTRSITTVLHPPQEAALHCRLLRFASVTRAPFRNTSSAFVFYSTFSCGIKNNARCFKGNIITGMSHPINRPHCSARNPSRVSLSCETRRPTRTRLSTAQAPRATYGAHRPSHVAFADRVSRVGCRR